MIELVLAALLQATEPQPAPPRDDFAQEAVDHTESAEVVAERSDDDINPNRVRTCQTDTVTNSRVRQERYCQSPNNRRETQDAFRRRLDEGGFMGTQM
jgi:hypothetical protein